MNTGMGSLGKLGPVRKGKKRFHFTVNGLNTSLVVYFACAHHMYLAIHVGKKIFKGK